MLTAAHKSKEHLNAFVAGSWVSTNMPKLREKLRIKSRLQDTLQHQSIVVTDYVITTRLTKKYNH